MSNTALNTIVTKMETEYAAARQITPGLQDKSDLQELFALTVEGSINHPDLDDNGAYRQIRGRFLIDMELLKHQEAPFVRTVKNHAELFDAQA